MVLKFASSTYSPCHLIQDEENVQEFIRGSFGGWWEKLGIAVASSLIPDILRQDS